MKALPMAALIMLTGAIGLKWHFGDTSPEGITWLFGLLIITTLVFYSVVFLGIRITGPGWALDQIREAKNEFDTAKAEIELLVRDLIRLNSSIISAITSSSMTVGTPPKAAIVKAIQQLESLANRVGIEKEDFYSEMSNVHEQIFKEMKADETEHD